MRGNGNGAHPTMTTHHLLTTLGAAVLAYVTVMVAAVSLVVLVVFGVV